MQASSVLYRLIASNALNQPRKRVLRSRAYSSKIASAMRVGNGAPVDLTGRTARFSMKKADGTLLINKATATIVDAEAGRIR